jgi:AcrR family transcriptional regulator
MVRAPRSDAIRNRQRLLDAATDAFTASGVATPLETIAECAGVSIGTLYNHFGDRGGLVEAVLSDLLSQLSVIGDSAALCEDPWEAFEKVIVATCELQAADRAAADVLGGRYRYPDTGEIHAAYHHLMDRFVEIIERAKAAGSLRDDFGIEDVGPIMWSIARIIEVSEGPEWRRHLTFVLDGLHQPPRKRRRHR